LQISNPSRECYGDKKVILFLESEVQNVIREYQFQVIIKWRLLGAPSPPVNGKLLAGVSLASYGT